MSKVKKGAWDIIDTEFFQRELMRKETSNYILADQIGIDVRTLQRMVRNGKTTHLIAVAIAYYLHIDVNNLVIRSE